jgi:hypothetical protein
MNLSNADLRGGKLDMLGGPGRKVLNLGRELSVATTYCMYCTECSTDLPPAEGFRKSIVVWGDDYCIGA